MFIRGKLEKRTNGSKGRGKSISKSKNKKNYKEGYFKRNCPSRKGKNCDSKNMGTIDVSIVATRKCVNEWVLDYGCIIHMCPNKKWFRELNKGYHGKVLLGNNYQYEVKNIGYIEIKLSDDLIKYYLM